MKRYHTSPKEIIELNNIDNSKAKFKPLGLWYSFDYFWKDDEFKYELIIPKNNFITGINNICRKDNLDKILVLSKPEEYLKFAYTFLFKIPDLKTWLEPSQYYAGIEFRNHKEGIEYLKEIFDIKRMERLDGYKRQIQTIEINKKNPGIDMFNAYDMVKKSYESDFIQKFETNFNWIIALDIDSGCIWNFDLIKLKLI